MTTAESCDLLVAVLAELREARADRNSYRALAQQALHQLAALRAERDRLRAQYVALLDAQRDERRAAA